MTLSMHCTVTQKGNNRFERLLSTAGFLGGRQSQSYNADAIRPRTERAIPSDERWLHDDPLALAEFNEGIRQVERGEVVSLGSFAQYLDSDG